MKLKKLWEARAKKRRQQADVSGFTDDVLVEQLEPRVLLSADAISAVMPVDAGDQEADTEQLLFDAAIADIPANSLPLEIVFVDTNVDGYQDIVADLTAQSERNFDIHIIDGDGFKQITGLLDRSNDVGAIHIIGHGDAGLIELGDSQLSLGNIDSYREAFASWADALSAEADILFYGCDVAGNVAGETLLEEIADLTGADVAASEDVTGASSLGGDWALEFRSGTIGVNVAPSLQLQASFLTTLDISTGLVAHYEFDEGAGTTAIDSAGADNTGTHGGTPTPVHTTGPDGSGALDFSGGDDAVVVAGAANLDFGAGDFSIAFWYNTALPTGAERLIGKLETTGNLGFAIFADQFGNINFIADDDTTAVNFSAKGNFDSSWHHAALIRSGNNFEIFIDGTSAATDSAAVGDINNSRDITIGTTDSGGGGYDGLLDDVRLYTRALSAADVGELIAANGPSDLTATVTTEGGLSINQDAGNDAYLIADNASFMVGTVFSAEFQISALQNTGTASTLFSNVDGAGTADFKIHSDGRLSFAGFAGAVANTQLFDGADHSAALTWNGSSGEVKFYVDGVHVDSASGATGVLVGTDFVLGQDQDAVGGPFDPNEAFAGVFRDARLFDAVRTDSQIATSYNSTLPHNETNMVVNWRFDDVSIDGVVTDAVSGNNLTVSHASGVGFTTSNPALTLRLDENAQDGTVVGNVVAIDVEREAAIATLLASDPSLSYNAETGKFYKIVDTLVNWSSAQTAAIGTTLNGESGQLVVVESATENSLVQGLASTITKHVWLGFSDQNIEQEWRAYEGASESELVWRGDGGGSPVNGSYTNWLSGEPNSTSEDFAQLNQSTGLWNDLDSAQTNAYVIEWNADAVLDVSDALTYAITAQPEVGAFAIDADSGVITVADGSKLDYETRTSHTLSIEVTDSDSNTRTENFTVSLSNLVEINNPPSDASSGIEINTDGGNDAYLISNTGLATSLSATTVEIRFAANDTLLETVFMSFNNATDDEFTLQINDPVNDLELDFGNGTIVYANSINYRAALVDGDIHSLAVSWDSSNGDWAVYIDGEFTESGTGLNSGVALDTTNGQFVFGQEQDGLDSGYDPDQHFSGTYYDVRIWNEVRSEAEIALNYQHKLDLNPTQAAAIGLLANWQMNGFDGSNEVVDIVSGNNLSISHAPGAGFTASTPVEDLHISEHAIDGASLGYVVPSDPDISNDVVVDGLFLQAPNPGAFQSYAAPSTFGDWTVEAGEIELLGSVLASSPLGGRSVDLNETSPGIISQILTVEAGKQYQVVFALTGNHSGGETTKDVRVSVAGQSEDFAHADSTKWSTSNPLWDNHSFIFTADDTSATLRFESLDLGVQGAIIADVQVIEIPAAVTSILNNDATLSYDAGTGKFYQHVDTISTFSTARDAAVGSSLNGVSGQLVTIDSAYENELIRQFVLGSGNQVWLGASDAATEGEWNWLEGANESNETFWNGGAAGGGVDGEYSATMVLSDGSGEDYLRMTDTGRWNDSGGSFAYVIEWDANEVLSNFSFSLTDASNNFQIDSNTGEITVAATNTLDYETNQTHSVDVTIIDAAGQSYMESMTIVVDNGPGPAQSVPAAQNVDEDTVLTFSTGNGNEVKVTDTLSGTDVRLQVALSVNDGVLNLSGLTGIAIIEGANGSNTITINGTESDLNAALQGMTFTPNMNFNGSVTLNMTTSLGAELVGHYTFDAGDARDDGAGTAQNGTLSGGAITTPDATRGEVLTLDGVDDFVDLSASTADFAAFTDGTISGWIKTSGTNQTLFSLSDTSDAESYAALLLDSSGYLTYEVSENDVMQLAVFNGTNAINDGNWHHVAVTIDSSGNRLFVDGLLLGPSDITYATGTAATQHFFSSVSNSDATLIGRNENSGAARWHTAGDIDDTRIYSRALSADEIDALANGDSAVSNSVAITVDAVNDAPTFGVTLDGNPTFVEDGAPVVLDADVSVFDQELSGLDNFDGATLTLARNGAANADDDYRAETAGTLATLTQGTNNLVVGATTIGSVTQNSGGTLVLTFNNNATNALVDEAMQQIAYSNSSEAPPANAQIDWTFDDGNTAAAQGSGGAMSAIGSTTVDITAVNDSPNAVNDPPSFGDILGGHNPITNLTFGELAGTIADDSGSADNDASYQGGVTLAQPGAIAGDTAVNLDGIDDYIRLDHDASYLLDNGTVQMWFNTDSIGVQQGLFSKDASGFVDGGHTSLYIRSDGRLEVRYQTDTTSYLANSSNAVSTGVWHHAAVAFGDLGLQLYLDGQLVDSNAVTGGWGTTSGGSGNVEPISIGASRQAATSGIWNDVEIDNYFSGSIDEFAIIGEQLDEAAIAEMYAAGNSAQISTEFDPAGDSNAVGYWRLGESAGTNANNEVSGGTDGTYNNVTLAQGGATSDGDTSADFNGTNSHVDLGALEVNGSGITMAAWINADDFDTTDARIISKAGSTAEQDHTWMLSTDSSGGDIVLRMRISAGGTTDTLSASGPFLNATEWYHVAGTYDQTTGAMTLYVNGIVVDTKNHSVGGAVDQDATHNAWIGGNPDGSKYFDGRIDDALILERELSVGEVRWLAQQNQFSYDTDEATPLTVSAANGVLANDSDPDGDTFSVTQVEGIAIGGTLTLTSGATVTMASDGSFVYDPNGSFETLAVGSSTTDSFIYTVDDANSGTDTATATIVVMGQNDAPTLGNGVYSLPDITEDQINNVGRTVQQIIDSAGGSSGITDVDGGPDGIAIVANNENTGTWQYSTDGTNWLGLSTVSGSSALLLDADDLVRYQPNGNEGTPSDFDFRAWDGTTGAAGQKVNIAGVGGTTAFSSVTESAQINVTDVNDAPVLHNLDGNPTFVEGGTAVVLDANVSVLDSELSVVNNFDGATLTLARNGGASPDDVYSAVTAGTLAALTQGTNTLLVGATTIGSVTQNAGGTLVLTFNSNATNALVNQAMQQIAYSNPNDTPPASAQINWTFDDGGDSVQLQGGSALQANGSTTVNIQNAADLAITAPATATINEDTTQVFSGANNISVDDGIAADTRLQVSLSVANGLLTLANLTGITFVEGSDSAATMVIKGLQSNINTALAGLVFTPNADYNGADTLNITTALAADLQGYYTFETDGSDQSAGTSQDGALTNGALITNDGQRGNVLLLDGVDDFVELSGSVADFAGFTEGTISGWIKTTGVNQTIFSISDTAEDNSYASVFLGGGGFLTFEVMENGVMQLAVFNHTNAINDGNWHHVAVTVNSSGNSLYVDGQLVQAGDLTFDTGNASTQAYFSDVSAADSMAIGRTDGLSGGRWHTNGSIDDVRVYSRSVSADEVATQATDQTEVTNSVAITVDPIADAPVAADDRVGLVFDGTDDFVNVGPGTNLTMTSNMTMEVWFRTSELSSSSSMILLNKEGEYEVAVLPDGTVQWAFANTNPGWAWHDTGYTVELNEWTHVAVTYDLGTVVTYVNGIAVDTYSGSGNIGDAYGGLNDFRIGGRSNNPTGQYFDGSIGEVRLWNVTRLAGDILANYDQLLSGAGAELVGNWLLTEGSGTTAVDSSGTGNNGDLGGGVVGQQPTWVGYTTGEDAVLNIAASGVLLNDVDADLDMLTVTEINGSMADVGTQITLTSGALVTLNSDGRFDYDPNGVFNNLQTGEQAQDQFTYTVDDGNSGTDTATVVIIIKGSNDIPTVTTTGSALSYIEDDAATIIDPALVLADPENDDITGATVSITSGFAGVEDVLAFANQLGIVGIYNAGSGVLTLAGTTSLANYQTALRTITYQNTSNDPSNTTRQLSFAIDDAAASSVAATRDISVTPRNDAPQGADNTKTTLEETDAVFDAIDFGFSDPIESDLLANVIITTTTTTGILYIDADGNGLVSGTEAVNDLDTVSIADITAGRLKFKPVVDGAGNNYDSFTFQVQDDGGAANGGTNTDASANLMTIDVTGVNDAPTVLSGSVDPLTVNEDSGLTSLGLGAVTYGPGGGADESGQTLTYSVTVIPDSVTFGKIFLFDGTTQVSTGPYSLAQIQGMQFRPEPDVVGGPSFFTFQVLDNGLTANGGVNSLSQSIQLDITPINDSDPVADDESFTVLEGATATQADLDVGATLLVGDTDADLPNDTLTISVDTGPTHASAFTLNTDGTFSYTHNGSENFTDSFTYTLSDANGGVSDTGTVTITITPVNDNDPVANDDAITVNEGATATVLDSTATSVLANDTDIDLPNDTLTVTVGTGPSFAGAFTLNADGTFSYTHDGTENFTDSFTYVVSDADGGVMDTGTVNIVINPVNDNDPVADNESFTVAEGGTATEVNLDSGATLLTGDTDVDLPNDALTISLAVGPAHATTFTLNSDGTFSYTHDGSENLSDSFTYTLTDADGGVTDTGTVNITVTPVNDNDPNAVGDTLSVTVGSTVTVLASGASSVLVNDGDLDLPNDTLTASLLSGPSSASSFTLNADGTFSYTHDGSVISSDSFTYTVSDANGGATDSATVTITIVPVAPVNSIPVITSNGGGATATISVPSNNAYVTTVSAIDADGETLSFAIVGGDAGRFSINSATGEVTLLDPATPGTYVLDVAAIDTSGARDEQSLTVIAAGSPDVPIIVPPPPAPDAGDTSDEPTEALDFDDPVADLISSPEAENSSELEADQQANGQGADLQIIKVQKVSLNNYTQDFGGRYADYGESFSAAENDAKSATPDEHKVWDRDSMLNALALEIDVVTADMIERVNQASYLEVNARHSVEMVGLVAVAGLMNIVLKASGLVGAAMSSIPLWRWVDPMPILSADAESRRRFEAAKQEGDRYEKHLDEMSADESKTEQRVN